MKETSIQPRPAAEGVDLTGRSALVTGAASGIGRACAERLARAGAAVTVLDLNGDAAKSVAEKIGGEALKADLSDYGVLDSLRVKADVVVNNAGLQRVARIEDFPPEHFSAMLRLMLKAPFRIVRAALPGRYEKGWGRVINVYLRARHAGFAVQGGLRGCQARLGRLLEGLRWREVRMA